MTDAYAHAQTETRSNQYNTVKTTTRGPPGLQRLSYDMSNSTFFIFGAFFKLVGVDATGCIGKQMKGQ